MTVEDGVWQERKAALDRAIAETLTWAVQHPRPSAGAGDSFEEGQRQVCIQALRALQPAGDAAFAFFDHGFRSGRLRRSRDYSRRYVLRTILDQMSVDLNLLQKAIFQRRCADDGQQTEQARTLALADRLAQNALRVAAERGFVQAGAVVTHLAKQFDIRIVPYAEIVLIGVPYTTFKDNDSLSLDYLGIAHEVGHFIFERGKVPGTNRYVEDFLGKIFREKLGLAENDWRMRWLEELFGDAYGCLVAGPVNVLSLQERLKDNRPSTLRRDTGEHPIPILRPLIQTQMLRKMTLHGTRMYSNAPDRLDETWRKWVGDRDLLGKAYEVRGLETAMTGQAIMQALDEVIDLIIDTLEGRFQDRDHLEELVDAIFGSLGQPQSQPASFAWTRDLEDGEGLDELVRQFTQRAYPFAYPPQSDTDVAQDAPRRFAERLHEFSARCSTVDELIGQVLFEDWETEFEEDTRSLGFIDGPSGGSIQGFIDGPSGSTRGISTQGFIDGPSGAPTGGSTEGFIDGPS